ncbi:hypothetical protein [Cupriavidus necator]
MAVGFHQAALSHKDLVFYLQLDTPIPGAVAFIASEEKTFDAFKGFTFKIHPLFAEGTRLRHICSSTVSSQAS